MSKKILLDTDIGTDIDDAVCLAYLLAHPECELMGITTVTGESEQRAMLASALCRVAQKDIPIFPGAENPLLVAQKQTTAPQAAALKNWDHQIKFPKGEAVEFLRHTIRANPGEIVLLTIGPLTNIGLLFAADPEIPSMLKGLVMMCGYFFQRLEGVNRSEWNAYGDPHATAIVYRAQVPLHRSIGLDVTCQVTMAAKEVKHKFQADLLKPVLNFAEVWFEHYYDYITFHDPLAATTIFDNSICRYQSSQVRIELQDSDALGFTHWHPGSLNSPHQVASEVNRERFFEHYFSVVK